MRATHGRIRRRWELDSSKRSSLNVFIVRMNGSGAAAGRSAPNNIPPWPCVSRRAKVPPTARRRGGAGESEGVVRGGGGRGDQKEREDPQDQGEGQEESSCHLLVRGEVSTLC